MLIAYRAALPGVALLCSLVAFILALCCLLAGTNSRTLHGMELYTLNTSKVGTILLREMNLSGSSASMNLSTLIPRDSFDSILSDAENGLEETGGDLADAAGDLIKDPAAAIENLKNNITESVDGAKQQVSNTVSKAEDAIKNATGQIVGAFINETLQAFQIRDFYVAHLLTYCEGNYTAKGKDKVTFCSNHKPNDRYNLNITSNGTASKDEGSPLAFIEALHLPDPIKYALKALTLLTKIISAFYIVGSVALATSLISYALLIPAYFAAPDIMGARSGKSKLLRWASLALSSCAFFTLLLASTMVHFLAKKICAHFHEHPGMGIAAYPGARFLECSWASVILIGIAMMLAVVDVAMGVVASRARSKLGGAAEKRKWWGRRRHEEKSYEMET